MATVKLTRKAMDVKSLRAVTDDKFVRDAKTLLGYKMPEQAMALRKTAEVLAKLDIKPIDNQKVEAYKKAKAESVRSSKTETDGDGMRYTVRVRGEWETRNLQGYDGQVPGFAVIRAAAVKRELNRVRVGSNFQIDELHLRMTRRRREPRIADPFMVLVVGDERIFLDVWDEPSFEGRRTR